jgi:hypothetical protein
MCQMSCSQGGVTPPRIVANSSLPATTRTLNTDTSSIGRRGYHDNRNATLPPSPPEGYYTQEEIILRIPLSVQMTRYSALKALRKVIPEDVQRRVPLDDLDDFALLTLALAHERGRMHDSMYWPYIASLPVQPSCGYSPALRSKTMETIASLGFLMGLDVNGWPTEIIKVYDYSERISSALAKDYGLYLAVPKNVQVVSLLQWALCQVASRAIGGRALDPVSGKPITGTGRDGISERKSLRLVPMVDLINHDIRAGMLQELYHDDSETEQTARPHHSHSLELEDGRVYTHVKETEQGTYIVRNLRDGQAVALAQDQELLINYNVPEYSALDWFITMGFVPPERMGRWVKIEGVLPKIRVERSNFGMSSL